MPGDACFLQAVADRKAQRVREIGGQDNDFGGGEIILSDQMLNLGNHPIQHLRVKPGRCTSGRKRQRRQTFQWNGGRVIGEEFGCEGYFQLLDFRSSNERLAQADMNIA